MEDKEMKKVISFFMILGISFLLQLEAFADLNYGLVAYYPFNGNANDESGNGNDGTVYGATLTTDRFGSLNSAYSFDGIDDYVNIDSIVDDLSNTGTGTISLWFKGDPDDTCGVTGYWCGPLLYWEDDVPGKRIQHYFPLGGWRSEIPDSSISYYHGVIEFTYEEGPAYYFDDVWHHAVVVFGFDYNALYVDGMKVPVRYLKGESNVGNCMWGLLRMLRMAKRWSDDFAFTGAMDDVRFYNRPLSDTEIQILADWPASILPGTSEFGIIGIGCTSMQSFILTNVTDGDLELDSLCIVGVDPSEFIIQDDNCSGELLEAGGSCTFHVLFEPASLGSKEAAVIITFGDPNIDVLQVPLRGLVTEICECDLDHDHVCDMQDWLMFGEDWGRTDCNDPGVEPCECDLNCDGRCDMQDWLLFGQDWGRTDCPVCP
jgi:hypothetical protein